MSQQNRDALEQILIETAQKIREVTGEHGQVYICCKAKYSFIDAIAKTGEVSSFGSLSLYPSVDSTDFIQISDVDDMPF